MRVPSPAAYDRAWWWESAACRGADPEIFFPVGSALTAEIVQAKQLCATCPVRGPCLRYALSTGQEFGIWGGYEESERRALRHAKRHNKEMPPWFR